MIIPKPPKETLVDRIIYHKYKDTNDYGKDVFEDGIEIDFVRIDRTPSYSFSSAGRDLKYRAVIFAYTGLTYPTVEFTLRSKIVFDGEEHIVTNVIPNTEPYSNDLYSVEVEVV